MQHFMQHFPCNIIVFLRHKPSCGLSCNVFSDQFIWRFFLQTDSQTSHSIKDTFHSAFHNFWTTMWNKSTRNDKFCPKLEKKMLNQSWKYILVYISYLKILELTVVIADYMNALGQIIPISRPKSRYS